MIDKYYDSLCSYLNLENTYYDSDNSSTDEYDKLEREYMMRNNILSFIKTILTAIDYTLILSKIKIDAKSETKPETKSKTENVYSIKMNNN